MYKEFLLIHGRGQATRDSLGQEEVVHLKGELTLKKLAL